MPVTDNHKTPNIDPDNRDVLKIYIEHTKGVWIRHHIENGEVELWYDGNFQCSWFGSVNNEQINPHIATAMIAEAISIGKKLRSQEIKRLIG